MEARGFGRARRSTPNRRGSGGRLPGASRLRAEPRKQLGIITGPVVIDEEATAAAMAAGRNDPERIWKLATGLSLADLRDIAVTRRLPTDCVIAPVGKVNNCFRLLIKFYRLP